MKDASSFIEGPPSWWNGIRARIVCREPVLPFVVDNLSAVDCGDLATLADAARALDTWSVEQLEFCLVAPAVPVDLLWRAEWPLARRGREQPESLTERMRIRPGGKFTVLAKLHRTARARGRWQTSLAVAGRDTPGDAVAAWRQVARSIRTQLREPMTEEDEDYYYDAPTMDQLREHGLLVLELFGLDGAGTCSCRVFRWRRRYWTLDPLPRGLDDPEPVECRSFDEIFWQPDFQVLSGTEDIESAVFDHKLLAAACPVADETPDGQVSVNGIPYVVINGRLRKHRRPKPRGSAAREQGSPVR